MRTVLSAILTLAVSAAVAAPSRAQSCEDAERQLAALARRVAVLEGRLPPPAPPAPRVPAAAATGGGREEALELYKRVDLLVAKGDLAAARNEVAQWDQKYAGTSGAGWTNALNRELAVVGKSAPTDWAIDHWYQGESDMKLDGQHATLVVFWEAWCPHCREEVPKVEKIWEQYGARGLQVLGVTRITQTATEDSVRAFLAESGVRYPMAKETGSLADYFEVKGIPAAAVVKDGKVVWRGHPLRVTDDLLDAWF